jgi:CRP-like cAMP-binding protein
MALDDDIRILSGVDLFSGFTQEQLRLLAFGTETVRLKSGRELYREGAPADCAFVLVDGRIGLYRNREGQRVNVGTVEPGAILGEFALIAESRRLTGAMAETEIELIRVNRTLFRRILQEYPDLAALLHDRIAADLQAMLDKIGGLSTKFAE